MSILSVDTIQPIGSGSTVTLNAAKIVVGTGITFESNGQAIYAGIITATSFSGTALNASGATGDFSIADSIVHSGDTNTKIRFPAADTVTVETAGSERLRIKSDGTVYTVTENKRFGIGQDPDATTMGATSGTWQVPEVDGQTIGSELRIGDINTSSTAVIRLASYGSGDGGVGGGAIMFTNTRNGSASAHSDIAAIKGARESLGKGYLRFFTANSGANVERLRISSAGLVGIATNSPSAAWVDIATSSGSYDHIRLRRLSSDSNIASNWSLKPYGGNLYFRTGGSTDKIYFDDSGDLYIMDGNLMLASGHGIDFAATSDASGSSSELFDDYEEGSFTPTSNASLSDLGGRYTKIGRQVTVHVRCTVGANSSSNQMNIAGFPYSANMDSSLSNGSVPSGFGYIGGSVINGGIQLHMNYNAAQTHFYNFGTAMTQAAFSGRHIRFGIVYYTS